MLYVTFGKCSVKGWEISLSWVVVRRLGAKQGCPVPRYFFTVSEGNRGNVGEIRAPMV